MPSPPIQPGDPRPRGPEIPIEQFLANLPLFNDLTPEEIRRVASGTRRIYATKGESLFRQREKCEGFHVVLYGQVKLFVTSPQGAEKVIELIGPGMTFGEAILFMEMPYVVSAEALKDSLLLHVAKETVFEELERDPRFARRMLAGMSRKLHMLVRDVESFALRSGMERVIGYLLRDESTGEVAPGRSAVLLPANKGVVASRLNLTPEYFSRILHELADAGLVTIEGRTVTVLDAEKLRNHGS
jgi:CRP-like cAMP-binding protein